MRLFEVWTQLAGKLCRAGVDVAVARFAGARSAAVRLTAVIGMCGPSARVRARNAADAPPAWWKQMSPLSLRVTPRRREN